jgi:ubiquitin C-terminal hydrolase
LFLIHKFFHLLTIDSLEKRMSYYLTNLFNTCHTNSSLQALFARVSNLCNVWVNRRTACLRSFEAFRSNGFEWDKNSDLISKFVSLKPQFEGSDQLFAQELLKFIIDLMREEVNKATKTIDLKPDPLTAKESWNTYTKFRANSFLV